jgi:hypothetical protein
MHLEMTKLVPNRKPSSFGGIIAVDCDDGVPAAYESPGQAVERDLSDVGIPACHDVLERVAKVAR